MRRRTIRVNALEAVRFQRSEAIGEAGRGEGRGLDRFWSRVSGRPVEGGRSVMGNMEVKTGHTRSLQVRLLVQLTMTPAPP